MAKLNEGGLVMKINNVCYEKYIIYFLLNKKKIVYIGESGKGIARPFQHTKDKIFDSILIFKASSDTMERKIEEERLINLHKPIYNKSKILVNTKLKNLEEIRKYIRTIIGKESYIITSKLRTDVIKNIYYEKVDNRIYVKKSDVLNLIKNKYSVSL